MKRKEQQTTFYSNPEETEIYIKQGGQTFEQRNDRSKEQTL